ncbi:MAG: tetratricopeptide repeat protein [Planctomycetes bacterium]|nr:tetratricopeptide repeat protein [Planctomycetota bacterium]
MQNARNPAETFQAAVRSFNARDWAQAEALCRQLLAANSQHVDALHMLSHVLNATDRLQEAFAVMREAVALRPADPILWLNLGEFYRKAGQFGDAVECQLHALAIKEDIPEAHHNLSLAYRGLDQHEHALSAARRAVELWPDYAEAHLNLGDLLRDEDRLHEALAAYQRALQARPDWIDAHFELGGVWLKLGEPRNAVAHCRRILQLDPASVAARDNMRYALTEIGRIEEARAAVEGAAASGSPSRMRGVETPAEGVPTVQPINWVFIDSLDWDYDVASPLTTPMGGSQSALCYLARALSGRGHSVTTLTGTTSPRVISGVRCLSNRTITRDIASPDNTMIVVLNGPSNAALQLRKFLQRPATLILWTQHAHDQPAVWDLLDPVHAAAWDRVVCISDWQRLMYHRCLQVPESKLDVLRNAISPTFERMFQDAEELAAAKSAALRLAYASTPFRGLDVLASCFPEIRRRHPSCRLDVFSSMQVYHQSGEQDKHQSLYDQCRATEGIDYRGSVSQTQLAAELRGVHLLAYPNTFAETSCIAVMEALAAGALVVTSDLGALPETCAGWGKLVPRMSAEHPREQFERDFVEAVASALGDVQADRPAAMSERYRQVEAINAACTWSVRAAEWEAAAAQWLHARASGPARLV